MCPQGALSSSKPVCVVPLWEEGSSHHSRNPMERPRLEVYQPPASKGPVPAVLVCPGGGYAFRAPHEAAPVAQFFAQHGLVGVVCHYRVAPQRHPAPFADVARAMRVMRRLAPDLGVDPERIALMGFSAGGHVAAMVATRPDLYHDPEDDLVGTFSARPARVILAYPVISMMEDVHTGCLENLLGPESDPALRLALSADRWVTPETPPAFLFHTADDAGVRATHSLRYAAACHAQGVPVEFHLFAHGPHGVGLAQGNPALEIWPNLLLNWLSDWGCE